MRRDVQFIFYVSEIFYNEAVIECLDSEWMVNVFIILVLRFFVTKSLSGCVIFKNAAFSLRCVSLWKVKARGIPNLMPSWLNTETIALFCG